MVIHPLLLLSCLLAVVACSAPIEPIAVADGCPDQPLRGPSQYADDPRARLIDDFEHESVDIPRIDGRDGFWVEGNDETSTEPDATISSDCAARGQRAGHFAGSGFTSWGANWTALMRNSHMSTAAPYDATRYGGISFWAAAGPDVEAPYVFGAGVTTMDVAWNGGICNRCMDYYRGEVTIERRWQRFELRFAELAQSGTGDPLVDLKSDELVGVIFWPKGDFDLWIDDVRFEP